MTRMIMVPNGWPQRLQECDPGFFVYQSDLYFISEYRSEGSKFYDVFCSSGEYCCLNELTLVQPVKVEWVEEEL